MGIEKDIQRLFANILNSHNGNKAAAAASLGTNPVTFWGWATGKRKPSKALCAAIDNAGAVLMLPNERRMPENKDISFLNEMLDKKTAELNDANMLLHETGKDLSKTKDKLIKALEENNHLKDKIQRLSYAKEQDAVSQRNARRGNERLQEPDSKRGKPE